MSFIPPRWLRALLIPALATLGAGGSSLPGWADRAVAESALEPTPPRAAAWVLLDRTEFLYTGRGGIQIHHWKVVKVLSEEGAREGIFSLWANGGKNYEVRNVQGWNLPPGGKVLTVERHWAIQLDPDGSNEVTSGLTTNLVMPGVVPGSVVAFESIEAMIPDHGPSQLIWLAGPDPVLRWELEADSRWYVSRAVKVELDPQNLEPWTAETALVPGQGLKVRHLPALGEDLVLAPGSMASRPFVRLRFADPACPDLFALPVQEFGMGMFELMNHPEPPPAGLPPFAGEPRARLEAIATWLGRSFSWRAVYLTPGRGLLPLAPARTLRQHAGDCKDLATLAIAAARQAGFQGFPALARIGDGVHQGETGPWQLGFNHAIAAIQVPLSMTFPSAVDVDGARYVLYDPTARATPMGYLPRVHRNGWILLCLPGGGRWVKVPPAAIPAASVNFSLEGKIEANGLLSGTLVVREQGEALGLASTYLEGGTPALRRALVPLMALDPTAGFALTRVGDPCSADGIFQIEVAWNRQERDGPRGTLALPGLPPVPQHIHRAGQPRRLAIQVRPDLHWHWRATLSGPKGWTFPTSERALETPLRKARWRATLGEQHQELDLDLMLRPGEWSAADGVKIMDADWRDFSGFLAACQEIRPQAGL